MIYHRSLKTIYIELDEQVEQGPKDQLFASFHLRSKVSGMKFIIYSIQILQKNQREIIIAELIEKKILSQAGEKNQREVFLKVAVLEDVTNPQERRILEKDLKKKNQQEVILREHQKILNRLIRAVINQKDM